MASKLCKLLVNPKVLQTIAQRGTASKPGTTLPDNLRRNYQKFQLEDGVPIYLKGGLGDRLLLGLTLILLAVGLGNSAYTIYRLDHRK